MDKGYFDEYEPRYDFNFTDFFKSDFKGVVQTDLVFEAEIAKLTKGRFAERIRKEVLYISMFYGNL